MKIETQVGLEVFLMKLRESNIDIPYNVTLEIDSKKLQNEIIDSMNTIFMEHNRQFERGTYRGQKIVFKNDIENVKFYEQGYEDGFNFANKTAIEEISKMQR